MPLMKLQFQPGLNRETTVYANEGGWWDSDKVRFRMGYPEKIGGWGKKSTAALLGTCRAVHPWVALDSSEQIGFGTSQKYYVFGNGSYNDITPIRVSGVTGITFAAAESTLSAAITSISADSLTLTSAASFPISANQVGGLILIDSEQMRYTGISGNQLTGLTRGVNGTTVATHAINAPVTCATLTVTDTGHGAVQNDFVTFSAVTDAGGLGGNITKLVLEQEYQITDVLSSSTYMIEVRTAGKTIADVTTSTGVSSAYAVFSAAGDTGTGGGTTGSYQINTGLSTSLIGAGWGAGTWGGTASGGFPATGWGSAANSVVTGASLRIWDHDNYGQNLLYNVRDGGIYYWDKSLGYTPGVAISALGSPYTPTGAVGKAPTIAKQILVSDNDRHIIAFGCDDEFSLGTQDPLLIRFSDSESITEWRSLSTNSAGSIRIGSGSLIVTAVETKQQIIIITDTSVHAMQYLGPPYTFGLTMVSDNVSITSANAAIAVDDSVYWMGEGDFYIYNGIVSQVPCDVKDYIFSRIDPAQTQKITAGANINYGEVWWFYQSLPDSNTGSNPTDNDSYIVYNYQQRIWYYGSINRTAWTHKNLGIYPIAVGTDNYVYLHEVGTDDGSTDPVSPITAYIESSGQDLGDGDSFAFIWRVIPDVTFRTSEGNPSVNMTVKMSNFPGANFNATPAGYSNGSVITRTATYPVEVFTNQVFTRLRGRSFNFRIESADVGVAWRLGAPRLDVRTDGRR